MSKIGRSKALGIDVNFEKKEKVFFGDFLTDWLHSKVKVQRTQSTFRNYERIIRIHLLPLFGKLEMNEIMPKHADKLIEKILANGHNEKASTLSCKL